MAKTIVGLFDDAAHAQAVVRDLESAGFDRDDISLVRSNAQGGTTTTTAGKATDVGDNAADGAGKGAVVGTVAGLVALAIPGIGPILGMGPLLSGLTAAGIGAASGAAAGGLMGALAASGIPDEDAKLYTEGVRRGGTLVTVRADDEDANEAIAIFNRHNPIDIDTRASQWSTGSSGTSTASTAAASTAATTRTAAAATTGAVQNVEGRAAIPVVEEELKVGKREVQRGGIRVFQRVEERPVEEQVNLREEHVRVERRPVDRPADAAVLNKAFTEGSIEVTERAEEAVVSKTARVVEEVVVGKEATERTETVRDTVRRTDVEIQEIPGTGQVSRTDWDTYDAGFRKSFSGQGYTYDQARPAFRYGYDLAGSGKGDWSTVESDARTRWESSNPGTWDKFKDNVRTAYEKARTKVTS